FTDSVDLIAAAVAEVHLVGVHLEDLLLVEAGFELERDEDLDHLPLEALLRREKEILRQLLRERRAAAGFVVREEVCDSAFGDTEVVDAAVVEEVTVFNGGDGLHQARRDLLIGNQAALGAILVFGERSDELRFELVGGEG